MGLNPESFKRVGDVFVLLEYLALPGSDGQALTRQVQLDLEKPGWASAQAGSLSMSTRILMICRPGL